MGGGGCGGFGGGGGHVTGATIRNYGMTAYGYEEDWMARTKETIEKELKYRGIEPPVIAEIVDKIEEPSYVAPVIIATLATALVLTLIFVAIWESTP